MTFAWTKQLVEKMYNLSGKEESPVLLEGMTREGMYQLFAAAGFKRGAEIGVQRARNAWLMFQCIPDLHLVMVDPYRDHESNPRKWGKHHDKARQMAHDRMDEFNTVWIEDFSELAADQIAAESLDFVYIDGEHTYDFVMVDLILWARKVKPGGIVAGHDYDWKKPNRPKVEAALHDYARQYVKGPIYITDKRINKHPGDKFQSWLFIKS